MGCNGSSNTRNHAIKKHGQSKGQFKDRVIKDLEKRKRVSFIKILLM